MICIIGKPMYMKVYRHKVLVNNKKKDINRFNTIALLIISLQTKYLYSIGHIKNMCQNIVGLS